MSPHTVLEDRLRHGLHAAARTVPPAPADLADLAAPIVTLAPRAPRRRLLAGCVGVAAAAAVVLGGLAIAQRGGGGARPDDVILRPADDQATTSTPVVPTGPANGRVPGQAVMDYTASEVHTYDATGAPTGSLSLAPYMDIQAFRSDLQGGWVICGRVADADMAGQVVWFAAGAEPAVLVDDVICASDTVEVVGGEQGPTVIVSPFIDGSFSAVVLATGEQRELPITKASNGRWSATTGQLIQLDDQGGLTAYDLGTGAATPITTMGPLDDGFPSLSPDGSSLAFLTGEASVDPDAPSELVVYDLATGTELFRETRASHLEGGEVSYDGTTVAIGSFYEDRGPVTVINLVTGARYDIDAHGILP